MPDSSKRARHASALPLYARGFAAALRKSAQVPPEIAARYGRPISKAAADYAPGLPRRGALGDPAALPVGQPLTYALQRHYAARAGEHLDLRLGGPRLGLHSWAVPRAALPAPGERPALAIAQPIHRHAYAKFEGEIPAGAYGAGKVEREDLGQAVISEAGPDRIRFAVIHRKHPESFALVRLQGKRDWLLVNTTPQESGALRAFSKRKYTLVDPAKVEEFLGGGYAASAKVDGALTLYELMKDRIEAVSYRPQGGAGGKPIQHTYRIGGLAGAVPEKLRGAVLAGETYGVRGGKALPARELGGYLNAPTAASLARQAQRKVHLRAALFDVVRGPGGALPPADYAGRLAMLRDLAAELRRPAVGVAETETSPGRALALWRRIKAGKHPLTHEGLVLTPLKGPGAPMKAKLAEEADVVVRRIFPAEVQSGPPRAGGFEYALPGRPDVVVGRVGTGFDRATAEAMLASPQDYVGRTARIRAQEQFPSGAWRAPSFLALHEG